MIMHCQYWYLYEALFGQVFIKTLIQCLEAEAEHLHPLSTHLQRAPRSFDVYQNLMNVSLVISKQRLRLQPQQGRESVNSPSLRGLIREGDRPNERPCILRSSLNFYTYGRPYRVWVRAQNQAEVLGEEEEEEISWVGEENSTVAVLVDGKSGVRRWFSVLFTRIKLFAETQEVRVAAQIVQFTCSIIYVGLYILGTYSPAPRGSMRYILELMLCLMFAGEFMYRFFVNHPDAGSKFRMLTAPINIFDLLSFTPMLLEVLLQQFIPHFTLGRFDLKWAKLFRSLRVMRVGLLAGELRSMHLSTKRGHWLSAGANFKLIQLAASPIVLLFMASAVIQIVEHIPFHKAVYFVATTLSTVRINAAFVWFGSLCDMVRCTTSEVELHIQ